MFGRNSDKQKEVSEEDVTVNHSLETHSEFSSTTKAIYKSPVPAFCEIGSLIFEKRFHQAIELGNKLLETNPHSAGVHINLMDAYFKVRNESPVFYDKSVEHARLAMLYVSSCY